MNIYKPYQWEDLTEQDRLDYISCLESVILENRYRYYVQDDPVLEDSEYDYLEKTYEYVCQLVGAKSISSQFVDWNPKIKGALEAEQRVLNGQDAHSLWIKEMQPVWDRIGKPSKIQKKEDREV